MSVIQKRQLCKRTHRCRGSALTSLGHSNRKALGPSSAPAPRVLACLTQEGYCLAVECDLGALAIHTQRKEAMGLGAAGQANRNHLTSYSVLMTPGSLLALGWWFVSSQNSPSEWWWDLGPLSWGPRNAAQCEIVPPPPASPHISTPLPALKRSHMFKSHWAKIEVFLLCKSSH